MTDDLDDLRAALRSAPAPEPEAKARAMALAMVASVVTSVPRNKGSKS